MHRRQFLGTAALGGLAAGLPASAFAADTVGLPNLAAKAVPIGLHVMLDAERCILCSRCVRFCDTITKTGELGIFNRGDHSELGLFPGTTLDNAYSGNVVDICPVGALTDRDFRFQARVWYLDRAKSVCPGCARGCNIEVHTNTKRTHHAQGRRVVRLKPRFNADVNQWWICDEGRYGFGDVDASTRIERPVLRDGDAVRVLSWDEALGAAADGLRAAGPAATGVLFSPQLSNEDLWLARRLFVDTLGAAGADMLCRNATNQIAACSSSLRYKTDVRPFTSGLGLVERLEPIAFAWKDDGLRDVGFAAEAVATVDPRLVTFDSAGQVEGVGQVAHTRLTTLMGGDQRKQPQPHRVGQRLEQRRQLHRLLLGQWVTGQR